ncbi:unnamed protein product [Thlaspi arvense]|uniref:Uncharacterized protein n=1 Tax=Thlaspi arvense TaxID=13288 RepID=A0AAU9RPA8_THLAR|nr:unnamed protein product [Thlaspi arvense]
MRKNTCSKLGQVIIVVVLIYRTEAALRLPHEPLLITGRRMMAYNQNAIIGTPPSQSQPGGRKGPGKIDDSNKPHMYIGAGSSSGGVSP